MLTAALLALAVVTGTPWVLVGLLGAGLWSPTVGLACVLALPVLAQRRQPRSASSEAVWCGAMAAELRAGASLRLAIEAASARVPDLGLDAAARLARSGAPMPRVSARIVEALPTMRTLVGPALRIAAESGAAATGVFGRLAVRSLEEVEGERERKVGTAQVRMSAMVIAALPVVVLAALVASGRAAMLISAGPIGVGALMLGVGLQVAGVTAVWALSRQVSR